MTHQTVYVVMETWEDEEFLVEREQVNAICASRDAAERYIREFEDHINIHVEAWAVTT